MSAATRLGLTAVMLAVVLAAGRVGAEPAEGTEPEGRSAALRAAEPGTLLELQGLAFGTNEEGMPVLPVERQAVPGPQFLISDKPEYFRTGDGISLQERVEPGVVRLYVYHVPEPTGEQKTISAVIENLGDQPLHFRFQRYAFPEPGKGYQRMAKQALIRFWQSEPREDERVLEPGARMPVDPAMDRAVVTKNDLVHGLYEFEIDQPARITVFQRDPAAQSTQVIDELPKLPRVLPGWHPSSEGRGRFEHADFEVAPTGGQVYDTADGVRQVIVADGERDPWITGRDSISGLTDAPLKGNYGVMYRIRVPWRSSDGRGVAVLVYNPRAGGKWCNHQALAVQVNEGVFPEGIVRLPGDQVRYGAPPETALVQRFEPDADGTGTIEILYSPPGASCLPVPFVLVPYDTKPWRLGRRRPTASAGVFWHARL